MNLELTYNKTVEEVQSGFNQWFPWLRIEFVGKGSRLGDINKNIGCHTLELTGNLSVNELQAIFWQYAGLVVRVLRKSGNIWMETSITGNWTLARQNQHGKEISVLALPL